MSNQTDIYKITLKFLKTNPSWEPIVKTAYEIGKEYKEKGRTGGFAGSWVLKKAGLRSYPVNLRSLAKCGILKRMGGSVGKRKKRAAYYGVIDLESVRKVLRDFKF